MSSSPAKRSSGSPDLDAAHRRIQEWRVSRPRLGPMPAALWEAATQLARVHGVGPVARVLHLEYYALKKRLGPLTPGASTSETAFVEVAVSGGAAGRECLVEMERSDGTCIRLRGIGEDTAVALGQAFLRLTS